MQQDVAVGGFSLQGCMLSANICPNNSNVGVLLTQPPDVFFCAATGKVVQRSHRVPTGSILLCRIDSDESRSASDEVTSHECPRYLEGERVIFSLSQQG
jgi:hypothetical protein